MPSGHFYTSGDRVSGLLLEVGGPILDRNFFHGSVSREELRQLLSGLRSSLSAMANTPSPTMLWIFNGHQPERQSRELRYAILLWQWLAGDEHRPSFCSIALVFLDPPYDFGALISLIPPSARPHVFSIQLQLRSSDITPGRVERFLSLFPCVRDVYVQVVDVVESSGGLFTSPPGVPCFARDPSIPAGPPLPRYQRLSLTGAAISPDTTSVLQLGAVSSLSLYDQIIRDPDHMTVLQLLTRMPRLASLHCHMNWQFPERQRTFWAPGPVSALATRTRSLSLLDLAGYKDHIADFVNALARTANFGIQTTSLLLRCDCSDTLPDFDEITTLNDEVLNHADYVEVDVLTRTIKCKRDSDNVTFDVSWELTNTSIGFWSTARCDLVDARFVEYINRNFVIRVPRAVSFIGGDLYDLFEDVSVCELRTLSLTGPMAYLRNCIPFIRDNLDVFTELTTIHYTATLPFGLDMPVSYGWVVADGDALDPLPATPRFIDVYLRVPSMLPVDGQYQLRTVTVCWNTSVPMDSIVTLDPPTNTPF